MRTSRTRAAGWRPGPGSSLRLTSFSRNSRRDIGRSREQKTRSEEELRAASFRKRRAAMRPVDVPTKSSGLRRPTPGHAVMPLQVVGAGRIASSPARSASLTCSLVSCKKPSVRRRGCPPRSRTCPAFCLAVARNAERFSQAMTEGNDGGSSHRGGNPSRLDILAQLTLMFLLRPSQRDEHNSCLDRGRGCRLASTHWIDHSGQRGTHVFTGSTWIARRHVCATQPPRNRGDHSS